MIYTHVLEFAEGGVASPLDDLASIPGPLPFAEAEWQGDNHRSHSASCSRDAGNRCLS